MFYFCYLEKKYIQHNTFSVGEVDLFCTQILVGVMVCMLVLEVSTPAEFMLCFSMPTGSSFMWLHCELYMLYVFRMHITN